jgi:tellurite resistance protein
MLKALLAKVKDFHADLTKHDDLVRGVYGCVSMACVEDGRVDANERQSISSTMCSLFKNFEPHEVSQVVLEAIRDHADPEAGYIKTEELLLGVESAQEAKKIFAVMRLVAKKGDGVVGQKEKDLLVRFSAVAGISPEEALAGS